MEAKQDLPDQGIWGEYRSLKSGRAIGISLFAVSLETHCQERDRIWLFGGLEMCLSASSGVSTGS